MEDLPFSLRFVILLLLLGVNAFFAAAEVALVSVRETRIRELADAGARSAQTVLDLVADPDRMLSATQLGVTLASLGLGWAGESTVYRVIEPLFQPLSLPHAERLGHFVAFALAFTIITFLHMVVGEVVPKNFALERAERMALSVAPPLHLFSRITGLFVSMVERTAERVSNLLGLKLTVSQNVYTAEELKLVVSLSQRQGALAKLQESMLHRVIDFYDVTTREVMVPRQEMVALPVDASLDQLLESLVRHRHSRIPVFEGTHEQIIGVVYARDIWSYVQQIRRWEMLDRPPPSFRLRSFLRDVEFVPETKLLYELLQEFQEHQFHIAMVVDEFGTVVGLVTVEDALEQIVGEIRDEHERPESEGLQLGETIEVDGITNILDLQRQYHIDLPYDAGFETLAGFLLSRLGQIPKGGETVVHEGRVYRILDMEHNRIGKVRIEPARAQVTAHRKEEEE